MVAIETVPRAYDGAYEMPKCKGFSSQFESKASIIKVWQLKPKL